MKPFTKRQLADLIVAVRLREEAAWENDEISNIRKWCRLRLKLEEMLKNWHKEKK